MKKLLFIMIMRRKSFRMDLKKGVMEQFHYDNKVK